MSTSTLTLRPLDSDRFTWVIETAGRLDTGQGSLRQLPRPLPSRIRLLVPGDWVHHAAVTIAARNPRLIAQALPYALEDQLAEDLEALRIVHGKREADGRIQARIVQRERLDGLIAHLEAEGIKPDAAYSELDVLPIPDEGWSILPLPPLTQGGTELSLARASDGQAIALEPALLDSILGASPRTTIHAPNGPWIWLHRQLDEARAIDLLGGMKRAGELGERLRPWRLPATIAAVALVLQAGLMAVETAKLQRQRAALQADIERIAREAAPQVRRWVNPLAQMRQLASSKTTEATPHDAMLDLLARVAPLMANVPGVKFGSLRYQDGILEAQLTAHQAATLEGLARDLDQQPCLTIDLSEQRVEGGQAQARLRIKGEKG